jgi:hypothetical protein
LCTFSDKCHSDFSGHSVHYITLKSNRGINT